MQALLLKCIKATEVELRDRNTVLRGIKPKRRRLYVLLTLTELQGM